MEQVHLHKNEDKEEKKMEKSLCRRPVHSLLFVKSIPTIKLDDSSPARERASVTC